MIRVLIADDHEVVRRGLGEAIATTPDIRVAGEVAHGRAALDFLEADTVDVLLLDLSLPRVSGIEVLRRARELRPSTRVLVLSTYPEAQYAARMLQAGAAGYLSKDRGLSDVLAAIRMVARGHTLVPDELVSGGGDGPAKLPHDALSPREYQVFMLLLQGRSGAEIAAELDLSPSTVSNHLNKVREKLGARTNAEIVGYAHRNGLVG